jgi:hypothetical protein
MTRDSPVTDLWAWLGAEGASEGAPRHSRAAAAGSSRSGEGVPRSGLPRAGCVVWVVGKVPQWLGRLRRERREMSRDGSHDEPVAEPGTRRGVLAQGGARRP